MAKIENLRGCINRLKQTRKENRQTLKGRVKKDIQKPTSGTNRKSSNRYSNRSPTEKTSPRKDLNRPNKDSNTTRNDLSSPVVCDPGLKQDRTSSYRRNGSTSRLSLQSLLERQTLDINLIIQTKQLFSTSCLIAS